MPSSRFAGVVSGLGVLVIVGFYMSCGQLKPNLQGSRVLAPSMQPKPKNSEPTLGCATNHTEVNRTWKDPVTGRTESKVYRKADDINYFQNGWENRVASSFKHLTPQHTGEDPKNLRMVWIDVRTVNGVPHYHYYSNATDSLPTHVRALEPWSSSKVYGVAMAFHRMRFESGKKLGGTATINGNVSIAADMDVLNDVSSNQLAGFYKALAGRKLSTDMIRNWIRRPNESFGGFYGDSTYATNQTFTFRSPAGFSQALTLRNDVFTANDLSPLTLAEMIKRLGVGFKDEQLLPKMVNYSANPSEQEMRDAEVSLLPEDLRVLFYGTNKNGLGGMMYDGLRDIPHNMGGSAALDAMTGGKWRVFGKGGSGVSDSRGKSEESTGDWVCIPGINGGQGLEFALYAHIDGPNKVARLHGAIKKVARSLYPELSGAVVGGGAATPSPDQQFADKCQEASAQHEICSSDTIKVKSDANALFDAKPGELVCRTGQKRNSGSEERVYFASEPRGYAWVANPDQNICDKQ
jgi:hypothetical protein